MKVEVAFVWKNPNGNKVLATCRTEEEMFGFLQYVLDGTRCPEEIYICYKKDGHVVGVPALRIAEKFDMRKRNFRERLDNLNTRLSKEV